MSEEGIIEQIKKYRIIPVIAIDSSEHAVPLADALIEGGLPLAEITFRTAVAAEVIAIMKRERPELLLGAGTLLSKDNLKSAIDCGAQFGVAPGTNPDVVSEANASDFPFIPGIMTPSEIERAIALGAKTLKFFPAEASGGVVMLKALFAPYAHLGIKFVPTGGVNADNLERYLSEPCVAAVGGTWIATKKDMLQGNWEDIVNRCRIACVIAQRSIDDSEV